MGSHHQASHCSREPERDAHSFHLFLEFTSRSSNIWQNSKIKGILDTNSQQKICFYADNLLLYLQNPHVSLQETSNISNHFSTILHDTINWNKSTILPVSEHAWDSAAWDSPLPLHTGNIKYVGIISAPRLSELFNLNYTPLLKKIEDDYKRWTKLPLTLIGWIATVKMKTLPQINYLFSMIPTTPQTNVSKHSINW